MTATCETCRFWVAAVYRDGTPYHHPDGDRSCHRFPKPDMTAASHWCGEHSPREAEKAAAPTYLAMAKEAVREPGYFWIRPDFPRQNPYIAFWTGVAWQLPGSSAHLKKLDVIDERRIELDAS